jgi:serine/threonine protein kinase
MYITKDKKQIMKKIVHYKNDFVYERDIFWLERLADEPFVPTLLYKDDINKRFILKYFGERININNKPDDWRQQLTDILSILTNKYGWSNNDLKPTEILVSPEGKIGIVDFGWCMLNNDYACGKGFINNKFIPKTNDIFYELESRLYIKK